MAEETTDDIINSVLNEAFGNTQPAQGGEDVKQENASVAGQTPDTGVQPATNDDSGTAIPGTRPNNQSPNQQNANGQTPQAPVNPGRVRDDGRGNLVDAQGRIVAQSGSERRWYNEAQAASRQVQQTQQELEGLRTRLTTYEQTFATFQNLQLHPQDIAVGAQLYKAFLTDPRATIEYMMTEARKRGVQLEGMGGTVDTQAIRSILAEELAPIRQAREQQQREHEADTAAEKEYTDFVDNPRFPFARMHENEVAKIIQQNPQSSLAEAYLTLQVAAQEAGLDFSKPIAPQWIAKRNGQRAAQNGGNAPGTPANTTGVMPRVPLPNGRPGGGANTVVNSPRIASSSTSNSDIVREALREAGIL